MRFHFSFHKNLTKYTSLTLDRALNGLGFRATRYRHFNSRKAEFLEEAPSLAMASLNNHFLTFEELKAISGEENTASVFVRDPRDLLVSGYFYHKKGTERWTQVKNPSAEDYRVVNGHIPDRVRESKLSFCEYLNQCDVEEGLLIELEFRRNHFDSLSKWLDYSASNILIIDYSEIMRDERRAFARLGGHHGFNFLERRALSFFANRYRASNSRKNAHIRDPKPGQWRNTLTPGSLDALNARHPTLISLYAAMVGTA